MPIIAVESMVVLQRVCFTAHARQPHGIIDITRQIVNYLL
jgi:hypothetical protein